MSTLIINHPWKIIQREFDPAHQRLSESLFSIGNGKMGQRANFEEDYSGDSLQGSYIGGIYYPDKTRVGWWKIGYPEYFAKVLNSVNWIGLHLKIEDELLDLAQSEVLAFEQLLDMKTGVLERNFTARLQTGRTVELHSRRFYSMNMDEAAALQYRIRALNFSGQITVTPYLDFNVINEDSNYDEKFWKESHRRLDEELIVLASRTKKLSFEVAAGMKCRFFKNKQQVDPARQADEREKYAEWSVGMQVEKGEEIAVEKICGIVSSLYYPSAELEQACRRVTEAAAAKGFGQLMEEQEGAWREIWERSDIEIGGDMAAQQAIRFNIFQLRQTYSGEDERLNIGPKGFTGEKYGGSTYWDTEAYCLPFYLATAEKRIPRNLLLYRYKHLEKAKENARKLGFGKGAALYPMVTMNGEECHNEWEITFEEIHRNGAIAYAIYDYIRHTGDRDYIYDYGLEVLVAISRFWAQRFSFSEKRKKYVMLGVTGPNEYENNVDNNWYTMYIARWCMRYTMQQLLDWEREDAAAYRSFFSGENLTAAELDDWREICDNIHFPEDEARGIFLQQQNFLDKVIRPASDIPQEERPINQHWSWDRILRSCYIKQADVLQGLYFFEDDFSEEEIRRNFDFYEPLTVHESSLSPCVHAILAARLSYRKKAHEMYLRTARLDLDNINRDTDEGLHITSMAGSWMAVIKGMAGMRVRDNTLQLAPFLPVEWSSLRFSLLFRGRSLEVAIYPERCEITNESKNELSIVIWGQCLRLKPGKTQVDMPEKIETSPSK